jgi:hypothetical protein
MKRYIVTTIFLLTLLINNNCQNQIIPKEELLNLRETCWKILTEKLPYGDTKAWGISGDKRFLSLLKQLLEEDKENPSQSAILAIRDIDDPSGIELVRKFAEHADWKIRASAIITLIKLGDYSKFKQICKEADTQWREKQDEFPFLIHIKLGYQTASYMTIGAVKDAEFHPDPNIDEFFGGRVFGLVITSMNLGEIEDIRIAPLIKETILNSKHDIVKVAGAKALSKMGYSDKEIKSILRRCAKDNSSQAYERDMSPYLGGLSTKEQGIEGLAYVGDYSDIHMLKNILNDKEDYIRYKTAGALLRIINRLLNIFNDPNQK